jgi:hypothetical protein
LLIREVGEVKHPKGAIIITAGERSVARGQKAGKRLVRFRRQRCARLRAESRKTPCSFPQATLRSPAVMKKRPFRTKIVLRQVLFRTFIAGNQKIKRYVGIENT